VNEQEMRIDAFVTPEVTAALNAALGRWLIAGTPIDEPYPCRCKGRSCVPRQCPCTGRPDPEAGGGDSRRCCGSRYPAESAAARRVLAGGAFKWAGWQ
jgi:hypothetical protein